MDLEDELNRLFKDDRLDVRVAPEAETNVVKGARRVRRRRMVVMSAAGVVSALVITGGAVMLAQPTPQSSSIANRPTSELPITSGEPDTSPSNTTKLPRPETTTTTSNVAKPGVEGTTAPPPTEQAMTLGPTGIGRIKLGMSAKEAKELEASGQVTPGTAPSAIRTPDTTKTPNGCTPYSVKNGTIWIGRAGTVVAMTYYSGAVTPERVAIGSPQDAVKTAYRDFAGNTAKVPGNANARYQFTFSAGKVASISLTELKQECVG